MATIIDADGHVDEPRAVWQEYMEPAYREQVIQLARDHDGMDKLKIEGKVRGDGSLSIAVRFPQVRVAFFESGAGWLAYWLQRMDDHYEKMGRFAPWLKQLWGND